MGNTFDHKISDFFVGSKIIESFMGNTFDRLRTDTLAHSQGTRPEGKVATINRQPYGTLTVRLLV